MRRALWIITVVVMLCASMLAVNSCQVDSQEGGVPVGVTVTIPEGL
jgi:hypothetical protein